MLQVSPTDYHRFIYKCHTCLLGFKRRGMLVNHLAKRHPDISPDSVPELNLPILKTTRDYYCQYCEKVNIMLVNCWSWYGMIWKVWCFRWAGWNFALDIMFEWSAFVSCVGHQVYWLQFSQPCHFHRTNAGILLMKSYVKVLEMNSDAIWVDAKA
jgi:hypothetical protein